MKEIIAKYSYDEDGWTEIVTFYQTGKDTYQREVYDKVFDNTTVSDISFSAIVRILGSVKKQIEAQKAVVSLYGRSSMLTKTKYEILIPLDSLN